MIKEVNIENLETILKEYTDLRGGEFNQETDSEAMFFLIGPYCGCFILKTILEGFIWIGIQNATARITNGGTVFLTIKDALECIFNCKLHPTMIHYKIYYSDSFLERSEFINNKIEEFYKSKDFLLWSDNS